MFGSHLSIAGGLHNALDAGAALGLECVQIFTQNQRQWINRRLTATMLDLWTTRREHAHLREIVSHGSYLINLASPDTTLRRKSVVALRSELKRCHALGIDLLVVHPGAHRGAGEEAGLGRIVRSVDRAMADLGDTRTILCLETTAGMGTSLGHKLEHLRWIIDRVAQPQQVGVCLDTAHMLASGYDLTDEGGAHKVLAKCRRVIGARRIRVVHLNDSKTPRGSRVDRHEHIGHGYIGLSAFGAIINDPRIRSIPKILETPKDTDPEGRPWDEVNLQTLRDLVKAT